MLSLDVKRVLNFLDEKPDWSVGHATAIVSVLGEDLAAATLQHCLKANGATHVAVRPEAVGTGKRKGPRLDRWIEADLASGEKYLFQTEIKSWSAHAIGGKVVPVPATRAQLSEEKRRNWGKLWDPDARTLSNKLAAKVLVPMNPPKNAECRTILPLLIFWYPVVPGNKSQGIPRVKGGHLFSVASPTAEFPFATDDSWPKVCEFPELWMFSVSSYLRSLKQSQLELKMPQAAARLRTLTELVKVVDS